MFNKATEEMKIAQEAFVSRVADDWALVSAGSPGDFNTMTIGWGSAGTLWSTPVVTVYVHPKRYTHEFLMREDYFTVQLFDDTHKKDLAILGAKSGRDGDKVALTALTPKQFGPSMGFAQAEITLVCRKLYTHHMDLDHVPGEVTDAFNGRSGLYQHEAHTAFVGEVIDTVLAHAHPSPTL